MKCKTECRICGLMVSRTAYIEDLITGGVMCIHHFECEYCKEEHDKEDYKQCRDNLVKLLKENE